MGEAFLYKYSSFWVLWLRPSWSALAQHDRLPRPANRDYLYLLTFVFVEFQPNGSQALYRISQPRGSFYKFNYTNLNHSE